MKFDNVIIRNQNDFAEVLRQLAELNFDVVESYNAAINRVRSENYQAKLKEFKADHIRHISQINEILMNHSHKNVEGPSMKQWITKGRVVMADIVGDKNISKAMHENEKDTDAAYNKANNHKDRWSDCVNLLSTGINDEKSHTFWFEHNV